MVKSTTCSVEGCERNVRRRNLCGTHYDRLRKHGTTDKFVNPTPEQRFWAKVLKGSGCWEWTGARSCQTYGVFSVGGKTTYVHRFSWSLANGEIPEGVVIDHTCHNTICVNPAHLRLATIKQNAENRRGAPSTNRHSGVLGVYPNGSGWAAQVIHNGEQLYLGTYRTIAEAEAVASDTRRKLFTHSQD